MRFSRVGSVKKSFARQGEKIKTIAIIGLGCVGSRTAAKLSRKFKGKAKLLLVDFDSVTIENLGCQLYDSKDYNAKKAVATALKTGGKAVIKKITSKNAFALLKNADVIADCTDDWQARKTIDDFCAHARKPWVYSGALGTQAMVGTITLPGFFAKWAKKTPRVSCHEFGISTKACEWAAKTQEKEVARLIEGKKPKLSQKIAFCDIKTNEKTIVEIKNSA